MLERAVGVSALAIAYQVPADGHPGSVKLVEEATVLAFHAQALKPVRADCLQRNACQERQSDILLRG